MGSSSVCGGGLNTCVKRVQSSVSFASNNSSFDRVFTQSRIAARTFAGWFFCVCQWVVFNRSYGSNTFLAIQVHLA